jgi:hypothetical protein
MEAALGCASWMPAGLAGILAGACLTLLAGGCTSTSSADTGAWGSALPVPGVRTGGEPGGSAVWCSSPGNCTLAYVPSVVSPPGGWQAFRGWKAFARNGADGTWGAPALIPGLTSQTVMGLQLSCAGPGGCVVATTSGDNANRFKVLVASQRHGVWQKAMQIPGLAALSGGNSAVSVLSCSRAGWCELAGSYWPRGQNSGAWQPFVASEHDGVWSGARAVPGPGPPSQRSTGTITSLSCDPAGTCTAGGSYAAGDAQQVRPFLVTADHGVWGPARPVAGIAALPDADPGGYGVISAVSCASARNCAAAGSYTDRGGRERLFAVTEKGGTWAQAQSVPGMAATLSVQSHVTIAGLSCPAPGQCAIAGLFGTYDATGSSGQQFSATVAFVVSQVNGSWQAVREVRGPAAMKSGSLVYLTALSCGSPGNCAVGGYTVLPVRYAANHAFVVRETDGNWGVTQQVPGLTALGTASEVDFLDCGRTTATGSRCAAVGAYYPGPGSRYQWRMFEADSR